jgi:hypothetical protein
MIQYQIGFVFRESSIARLMVWGSSRKLSCISGSYRVCKGLKCQPYDYHDCDCSHTTPASRRTTTSLTRTATNYHPSRRFSRSQTFASKFTSLQKGANSRPGQRTIVPQSPRMSSVASKARFPRPIPFVITLTLLFRRIYLPL